MLAAPAVAALAPSPLLLPSSRAAAGVALPPLRPLPRSSPAVALTPAVHTASAAVPRRPRRRLGLPVALLALLLLLATLLAPEAPQDQAAICQRHNGAVACRVW